MDAQSRGWICRGLSFIEKPVCRRAWVAVLFLAGLLFTTGCGLAPQTNIPPAAGITRTLQNSDQPVAALFTATPGLPPAISPTPLPESLDESVLTAAQRERLYRASLEYVADTEAEAVRVARGLQFVENEGHPANFCGPLSIGILRDAGLVDRYTDLHNFWLLNPQDEYTVDYILKKTFPPENYYWYQTETPINEFDWGEFPLYAGDFLYLYAGRRGTFEHMITVSRVDEQGRAYAITAETSNGSYLISELMLYDPAQPGAGYFYDITDRNYSATLGMTGFGGFQLWRPIHPIPDPSPEEGAFSSRMDKIFESYGGEWHVMVKQVGGKVLYALEANEPIHPASVAKVPQAMLFFESLHQREINDLRLFLVEYGTGGRTYQQLLYGMLVESEEAAADSLLSYTQDFLNPAETLAGWGYPNTTVNPRRTTAAELTRIFEDLWLGTHLPKEENRIILEQLAVYTTGDDTRIGVIREQMPIGSHFYSKRGSLVIGRLIVGEAAILEIGDAVYIISIFGYPDRTTGEPDYDQLEAAIEDAAWVIWGYIQDLE